MGESLYNGRLEYGPVLRLLSTGQQHCSAFALVSTVVPYRALRCDSAAAAVINAANPLILYVMRVTDQLER